VTAIRAHYARHQELKRELVRIERRTAVRLRTRGINDVKSCEGPHELDLARALSLMLVSRDSSTGLFPARYDTTFGSSPVGPWRQLGAAPRWHREVVGSNPIRLHQNTQ